MRRNIVGYVLSTSERNDAIDDCLFHNVIIFFSPIFSQLSCTFFSWYVQNKEIEKLRERFSSFFEKENKTVRSTTTS